MNTKIETVVAAIVIGISLVVSVLVIGNTITGVTAKAMQSREQQLRNEAVDSCAKIAVAHYTNKENADITEPFKPTYIACLKDKGYQSKMGE